MSCPQPPEEIHQMQGGDAKSSVDDLAFGQGVILSRAATTLRSIETPPLDWRLNLIHVYA